MARNDERRHALADAAVTVLAQSGSRGLTFRAVDQAARVTPGTTSNFFASRDAIIEAALDRAWQRLDADPAIIAGILGSAASTEGSPNLATYAALIRDIVRRHLVDPDAARALLELRLEATRRPDVADVITTRLREGLQADAAFVRDEGLPGSTADVTLLRYAIDGLLLNLLTVGIDPGADPDAAIEHFVARIMRATSL